MKKVYCQTDSEGNVIDVIRGDGIILSDDEQWEDITNIPNAINATEPELQRKLKVTKKLRRPDGKFEKNRERKLEYKSRLKLIVSPTVIKADGRDIATIKLELVSGEYKKEVKIIVNGRETGLSIGEELIVTSDVVQRIGIKVIDKNVTISPSVAYVQATSVSVGQVER